MEKHVSVAKGFSTVPQNVSKKNVEQMGVWNHTAHWGEVGEEEVRGEVTILPLTAVDAAKKKLKKISYHTSQGDTSATKHYTCLEHN